MTEKQPTKVLKGDSYSNVGSDKDIKGSNGLGKLRNKSDRSLNDQMKIIKTDVVELKEDVKQLACDLMYIPGAVIENSSSGVSKLKPHAIDVMCEVRDVVLNDVPDAAVNICGKAFAFARDATFGLARRGLSALKSSLFNVTDLAVDAADSGRLLLQEMALKPFKLARSIATRGAESLVERSADAVSGATKRTLGKGKNMVKSVTQTGLDAGQRVLDTAATTAGVAAGVVTVTSEVAGASLNLASNLTKGAFKLAWAPFGAVLHLASKVLPPSPSSSKSSGTVAELYDKNGNRVLLEAVGRGKLHVLAHEMPDTASPTKLDADCGLETVPHEHISPQRGSSEMRKNL